MQAVQQEYAIALRTSLRTIGSTIKTDSPKERPSNKPNTIFCLSIFPTKFNPHHKERLSKDKKITPSSKNKPAATRQTACFFIVPPCNYERQM